eukprot:XP_001709225.1 Hypothetical protein GL50803_6493 [Giardia lamblia ATCC 50803]
MPEADAQEGQLVVGFTDFQQSKMKNCPIASIYLAGNALHWDQLHF